MYEKIAHIPGNIVECGVGNGFSLLSWCLLSYLADTERGIWAFDSFEGFPEPSEEDRSPRNAKAGDHRDTSIEYVKRFLHESEVVNDEIIDHIHFVKGFFNDTMPQYSGEPIALLHLDVDLYQSYLDCLNGLYEFVVPGGIILFDEYADQVSAFPARRKQSIHFWAQIRTKLSESPKSKRRI